MFTVRRLIVGSYSYIYMKPHYGSVLHQTQSRFVWKQLSVIMELMTHFTNCIRQKLMLAHSF